MSDVVKVLIAKPGLDGHDRGAKVVARAFEDAGAKVYYTGLHVTPEKIVDLVEKEHIDVVGVSLLSGAHVTLMPRIIEMCRARGLNDVVFILGGIIPQADIPSMLDAGVHGVFTPGTRLDDCTNFAFQKVAEMKSTKMMEKMGTTAAPSSLKLN
jgi:methylmalonyl-CoA mutase C-terminal domain/subunit